MHIKSAFIVVIIAIVAARNIASKYLLVNVENEAKVPNTRQGN